MEILNIIVPTNLEYQAERILYTKELLGTETGNYKKYQFNNEKPYWQRYKNYLLEPSAKYKLEYNCVRKIFKTKYDVIPHRGCLPKAMKKRGYFVEFKYLGWDGYETNIKKNRILL